MRDKRKGEEALSLKAEHSGNQGYADKSNAKSWSCKIQNTNVYMGAKLDGDE